MSQTSVVCLNSLRSTGVRIVGVRNAGVGIASVRSAGVGRCSREARRWPVSLLVRYNIYSMVSAQRTNLFALDSQIVSKKYHFSLGGCYAI